MDIRYYRQGRDEPVREYLDDMIRTYPEVAAKIRARIEILGAEGPRSKALECRHMGDGLWELKVRSHIGFHRIFFCITVGVIWLLHAFTKKSAKTPVNELETARKRMKVVMSNG